MPPRWDCSTSNGCLEMYQCFLLLPVLFTWDLWFQLYGAGQDHYYFGLSGINWFQTTSYFCNWNMGSGKKFAASIVLGTVLFPVFLGIFHDLCHHQYDPFSCYLLVLSMEQAFGVNPKGWWINRWNRRATADLKRKFEINKIDYVLLTFAIFHMQDP